MNQDNVFGQNKLIKIIVISHVKNVKIMFANHVNKDFNQLIINVNKLNKQHKIVIILVKNVKIIFVFNVLKIMNLIKTKYVNEFNKLQQNNVIILV